MDILAIFSPREPPLQRFHMPQWQHNLGQNPGSWCQDLSLAVPAEVLTNRWCLTVTKLVIPNLDLTLGNQLGEVPLRIIQKAVWP